MQGVGQTWEKQVIVVMEVLVRRRKRVGGMVVRVKRKVVGEPELH